MATTYLDSLDDQELDDLSKAIEQGATKQLPKIDALIRAAPKTKEMTFYKYYKDGPHFKVGGGLREPGYLILSTKKLSKKAGSVVAEFHIPGDKLRAIEFADGDVYFFGFGATVLFFPEQNGVVPATVEDAFSGGAGGTGEKGAEAPKAGGKVAAAMIRFNTGYIPSQEEHAAFEAGEGTIEEFYNKNHAKDGRFGAGKGGGGGGGGRGNPDQRNQQNRPGNDGNRPPRPPFKEKTKLQKIATVTRDVLAVVAVVTVAITIISFGQRQQDRSRQSKDYALDAPVREKKRQEAVHWIKERGHSAGKMAKDPPKLMDGYEYDKSGKVTRTPGQTRLGPLEPGAHSPGEGKKADKAMSDYFDNPSSMTD